MRDISNTLITAFSSDAVELAVAVELMFDSNPLRIWSGLGDKTINGNTFTGTGGLLNVSGIDEGNDLSAKGATVTLNGVDSSIVAVALAEPYQNRICKIHLGSGNEFFEIFTGFMDVMTINDGGQTCEISLQVESRLIALERVVPLRYTQETQQARYPGDTFFSFVADLSERSIVWGRKDDS